MMGLGVGGGCGVGLGLGWGIGLGWGSKYINQHFVFEETTRSSRAVDSPQVRFEGLLFAPHIFSQSPMGIIPIPLKLMSKHFQHFAGADSEFRSRNQKYHVGRRYSK